MAPQRLLAALTLALLLAPQYAFAANRDGAATKEPALAKKTPCDDRDRKICQLEHTVEDQQLTIRRQLDRIKRLQAPWSPEQQLALAELHKQIRELEAQSEILKALDAWTPAQGIALEDLKRAANRLVSRYEPMSAAELRAAAPAAVPGQWRYGTGQLFGLTRGVARSSSTDPMRGVWFLFSVPLDIAFLPFALLGGFAGSG